MGDFREWVLRTNPTHLFANGPAKEEAILGMCVEDVGLPKWTERVRLDSYERAFQAKIFSDTIGISDSCSIDGAHNAFLSPKCKKSPPSELDYIWRAHGPHCALYDAYEIYLYNKEKH